MNRSTSLVELRPEEKRELSTRAFLSWGTVAVLGSFIGLMLYFLPIGSKALWVAWGISLLVLLSMAWSGLRFWLDARSGKASLLQGKVTKKERKRMQTGIKQASEAYLYWIWVEGKKQSVDEQVFHSLEEGEEVQLRIGVRSKYVLGMEKS